MIDFGLCGVGDPACDLVIAWTRLLAAQRSDFREATEVDEGMWARGAGWALWKALVTAEPSAPASDAWRALDQLTVA